MLNVPQQTKNLILNEFRRLEFLTKDLAKFVATKTNRFKSLRQEKTSEIAQQQAAEKITEGKFTLSMPKIAAAGIGVGGLGLAIAFPDESKKILDSLFDSLFPEAKAMVSPGVSINGAPTELPSSNITMGITPQTTQREAEPVSRTRAVSKELTPQARALLDTIALKESGGKYNVIVGEGKYGAPAYFDDFSDHPRIVGIKTKRGPSTAAGRYQITKTTWDELKRKYPDLTDFSPANQDKAAWYLAQERYAKLTGRSLQEDLESNDAGVIRDIGRSLSATWTSLAGGVEQTQTDEGFVSEYTTALNDSAQSKDLERLSMSNQQKKKESKKQVIVVQNTIAQPTVEQSAPIKAPSSPPPSATAVMMDYARI